MPLDTDIPAIPSHPPDWFRQFRARLGITQVELAAQLGVSFATVNRWENGQNVPSPLAWGQIFKLDQNHSAALMPRIASNAEAEQPSIALFTELDILYPKLSRFFSYLFGELRQFFRNAGYKTRLYTGEGIPRGLSVSRAVYEELMADVGDGKICGVVAYNAHPAHADHWVQRLASRRVVPLIGDQPNFPCAVLFRQRQWFATAIRHLASQGRRRIALLGWWGETNYLEMFREEMISQGLNFRSDWVRDDSHPTTPGSGWSEFREIWTTGREKPDGLIISDDYLLPDACTAINDLRLRVPEQLSIVTHSNKGCPFYSSLPVTRVEYDTVTHARTIGELMLKLVRGETVAEPHVYSSDQFAVLPPAENALANLEKRRRVRT